MEVAGAAGEADRPALLVGLPASLLASGKPDPGEGHRGEQAAEPDNHTGELPAAGTSRQGEAGRLAVARGGAIATAVLRWPARRRYRSRGAGRAEPAAVLR